MSVCSYWLEQRLCVHLKNRVAMVDLLSPLLRAYGGWAAEAQASCVFASLLYEGVEPSAVCSECGILLSDLHHIL